MKKTLLSNPNFLIYTKRLVIRIFSPENITEKYLKALNQNEIIGLTESRHQEWDMEKTIQFIENANIPGESMLFGTFLKEKNKPIGNIRLFNFHELHNRAELSFLFYDKDEWNKGFATEALEAVLIYAFEKLKLHRIHADYYELNSSSAKLFEKLGFSLEGTYKDHFWLNHRYVDSIRVGKISHLTI
jgi:RimJ/RimL family protein N-acetyltransferase